MCLYIGNKAWPLVLQDLQFFIDNGKGKKMYFDEVIAVFSSSPWLRKALILIQNGWPSVTSEGVQPNSPNAVANVQNEHVRSVADSAMTKLKINPLGLLRLARFTL
jgi:hypothetical protein